MLNGWSIAIETTGGIVGIESHWEDTNLTLSYPKTATVPNEIITETLGTVLTAGKVHTDTNYINNLRTIAAGNFHYNTNNSNVIHIGDSNSHSNLDCPSPYLDKSLELLVKIARKIGDITAIDLDSGVFCLYSVKTFADNGYRMVQKKDSLGDPYYYTKNSSGIELMFESDFDSILDMTSTVIRCPASNALTAKTLTQLINKLDNADGSCSPLTFGLFREIAKS